MRQPVKIQHINLKSKILIYFIFLSLAFALFPHIANCTITLSVSPTITLQEERLNLDRLKLQIAGEFFRIESRLILNYHQRGFQPEDIVTALFFSGDSQRPLHSIFELQEREKDWEKVALKLGIPPNAHGMQTALTHGKGKKVGLKKKLAQGEKVEPEKKLAPEGYIFIMFISDYYQIERDRLWLYFEKGFTLNDLLLAVNLGAYHRIRFELLLQEREKGQDWSMILRDRNIQEDTLFSAYRSEIEYRHRPVIK